MLPAACSSASSRIWRSIRALSIATGWRLEPRAATTDAMVSSSSAMPATWASTGVSQVSVAEACLAAPSLSPPAHGWPRVLVVFVSWF